MAHERILVNLGTPRAPTAEAVRGFLAEFLSDPMVVDWPRWLWIPILKGIVLRRRPARIAKLYASIWTPEGSPLAVATEALHRDLQAHLGEACFVSHAYRYGTPSIPQVLARALARAETVTLVPLYPQRTASSSGTVVRLVERLAREARASERVRVAHVPPDDPDYIAALTRQVRAASASAQPDHLVVSFHSIPARVNRSEGRRYSKACECTYRAVLRALDWDLAAASLTYQSKFGPEPWLGPQTEPVLAALASRGIRHAAVLTPGFLTPGLETVEEIGVRARAVFTEAGGTRLSVVPSPCESPELLRALARAEGNLAR